MVSIGTTANHGPISTWRLYVARKRADALRVAGWPASINSSSAVASSKGRNFMKRLKIAAALLAASAAGGLVTSDAALAAYGFCSAPMAPSAFLSKPNKPYCFAARNCSSWEIDSYKRSVSSYYDDLRRYAEQVDSYYERATKYVECMSYLD